MPLNLKSFDKLNWMTNDGPLNRIGEKLDDIPKIGLLTRSMIAGLSLVDDRYYQAGLAGANRASLFQPRSKE